MAKKRASGPESHRQPGDILPGGYEDLLGQLKERIRSAQLRAGLAVNRELVLLYWQIGGEILGRQGREGWGAKVIDRLAADLRRSFPEMTGLSARNLKYMRAFAEAWPDGAIVQQAAAQIPWFHNCVLLDKVKNQDERSWYINKTIENGWSRNVLVHWIESDLYERQGKATTNFARSLPPPRSDLAGEILKDPYNFEFLTLADDAEERALQRGLLQHVQQFLVELGAGFAFVGQQHRLEVGGEDYYIDLLFYHLKLRCYVVVELKTTTFRPEYAGKMNFYCSVVDDHLRHGDDKPTIGLILCQEHNRVLAEYALRGMDKPIGVSSFELTRALPETLQTSLPSIEAIERELGEPPEESSE